MSGAPIPQAIMVLGIGNPDRGDDGAGPAVVERAAGRLPAGVQVRAASGDLMAFVDDWRGVETLIAIDAAQADGRPGSVHRLDLDVDQLPPAPLSSSHAFGLAEAVALARVLGSAPAKIIVFAIEGQDFAGGAALSEPVSAALAELADLVVADVLRLVGTTMESASNA